MKQILMIGTGGTIASGKTAEGLMPELTSEAGGSARLTRLAFNL